MILLLSCSLHCHPTAALPSPISALLRLPAIPVGIALPPSWLNTSVATHGGHNPAPVLLRLSKLSAPSSAAPIALQPDGLASLPLMLRCLHQYPNFPLPARSVQPATDGAQKRPEKTTREGHFIGLHVTTQEGVSQMAHEVSWDGQLILPEASHRSPTRPWCK